MLEVMTYTEMGVTLVLAVIAAARHARMLRRWATGACLLGAVVTGFHVHTWNPVVGSVLSVGAFVLLGLTVNPAGFDGWLEHRDAEWLAEHKR